MAGSASPANRHAASDNATPTANTLHIADMARTYSPRPPESARSEAQPCPSAPAFITTDAGTANINHSSGNNAHGPLPTPSAPPPPSAVAAVTVTTIPTATAHAPDSTDHRNHARRIADRSSE